MTSVTFGKEIEQTVPGVFTTGGNATLDIDTLITTRLLEQANSGGGKSYTLRKLIEECAPHVQILLLDREGEFSTLREKYDFVLFGKRDLGADYDLSIKIASHLPKKLMELGVSCIMDMSELSRHEQTLFVKRFCEGMIALPKDLWRPVVVVLDEIHDFAPQKGKCESTPAVIDLASKGRKRGQCLWGATQRLSKLHKDVAAELLNKLIGRTGLDIDMERAADELGITDKKEKRKLRELTPGTFFAFGPSFAPGITQVKIGNVKTTHPKAGQRIAPSATPPPEKIRRMLSKLESLKDDATQKEKTDAELKAELASLRGKVLSLETHNARLVEQTKKGAPAPAREFVVKQTEAVKLYKDVEYALRRFETAMRMDLSKSKGASMIPVVLGPKDPSSRISVVKYDSPPRAEAGGSLRSGAMRILAAVGSFHPKPVTKRQVGVLVGMKITGGTFNTYLGELKKNGWVYGYGDSLEISEVGRANLGDIKPVSRKPEDLLEMWAGKFRKGASEMLRAIAAAYPEMISIDDLGEQLGMITTGGTFNTYLGELRSAGLVEKRGPQLIATAELFPK